MRIVVIVLLTTLMATVMSCGTAIKQAQQKVDRVFADLPYPPQAVLIERVSDVGGGSDPKCWTAYTIALYGTSQDFETVLSFYTETLPTLGWQETQFPRLFKNPDGTSIEILTERDAWASLAIPLETRRSSKQRFDEFFFVSLAYGNPGSDGNCGQ